MLITQDQKNKLIKLATLFGILFLGLSLLVFFVQAFITNNIDAPIQSFFWHGNQARYPELEPFMMNITKFGSLPYQAAIIQGFGLILFVSGRVYDLAYMIITYIIFSLLTLVVIKPLIARSRPLLQDFFSDYANFIHEDGFSFPSGHSASSMLLYGSMIIILSNWIKNKTAKYLLIIFLSLLIILIGVSRIYLGVHYPTDVLGGFLLGLFGLFIMLQVIYRNITKILQN